MNSLNLGPIYQRQHPEIRKYTKTAEFVMNDHQQTSSVTSMLNSKYTTVATIRREKDKMQSCNDVQNSKWPRSNTTASAEYYITRS